MNVAIRTLALSASLLAPAWAGAQSDHDPSGHWSGAIHAPSGDVAVAVDLVIDGGKLTGTFSNPGEQIKGFPLATATQSGQALKLALKIGNDGQAFDGSLSADGRSLAGDFLISVYAVPFTLERTGDAQIAAPPVNAAIDERLAGEWSSELKVGPSSLAVALTLANGGDGTASGAWASSGGTMTPVTIEFRDGRVTLASTVMPATYSGTLSADGREIAGVFKEGAAEQPMTFRRAPRR